MMLIRTTWSFTCATDVLAYRSWTSAVRIDSFRFHEAIPLVLAHRRRRGPQLLLRLTTMPADLRLQACTPAPARARRCGGRHLVLGEPRVDRDAARARRRAVRETNYCRRHRVDGVRASLPQPLRQRASYSLAQIGSTILRMASEPLIQANDVRRIQSSQTVQPWRGRAKLDLRLSLVRGQQRGSRHAVLQARPCRAPERRCVMPQPFVERLHGPAEGENLRTRQAKPGRFEHG